MKKSNKNVIQQMIDNNYKSMTTETKEKLFKVSNVVFSDKKKF